MTNLQPSTLAGVNDPFHTSTTRDAWTPIAPDGSPALRNAWRYVMGDFRAQLADLRGELAALDLAGQADVRRDSAVAFLDTFHAPAGWDAGGSPTASDAGMNQIRAGRSALGYLRTPNATLAAASADIQRGLAELVGRIALERFDAVDGLEGVNPSRLSQAQAHLDLAAGHLAASPPSLAEAYLQYQKAWEVLKNEPSIAPAPPVE